MKQAGKPPLRFLQGLSFLCWPALRERWTRSCENTKPSGNGPGSTKHVEGTGDIVQHLGVRPRPPRRFGGVVERWEKVLLERDDGGKKGASKGFKRPCSHSLGQRGSTKNGVVGRLLIDRHGTRVPTHSDGGEAFGPGHWPFPHAGINHQEAPLIGRHVGLDHGQRCGKSIPAFIQRDPCDFGLLVLSHNGLPTRFFAFPWFMGWDPIWKAFLVARVFIDEVGAVVPKAERTRVEKLVDGCKPCHSCQQVLFDFSKVWSDVERENTGDFAQVKRSFCTRLEGFKNMAGHQRRKRPPGVGFHLQTEFVENTCTRVPLPCKGLSELKQFRVKALESTGFGEGPCPNAGRVKKWKFGVFGCSNTSGMKRHETARLVIKEDGQSKIDMEETNQTVEGQVVLRRNDHAGRMKAFKEMLAMQFSGVKHQEGSVFLGLAQGIEKPPRATFTRRDVLG